MKTLLLPTDFSANSRNAIFYALQLCGQEPCHFELLHVYKVNDFNESSRLTPIPTETELGKARKNNDIKLKQLAEELKSSSSNKHHTFSFRAVNKPLVAAVEEEIVKHQVKLVVIGTHGHTGASEVIYGSHTVNLMEEIQGCPILAVPATVTFHSLKEIVLAHGFKTALTPNDLEFLIQLCKKFQASIRILHIAEEGGLNERQKKNKKWLIDHLRKQEAKHSFHSLEFLSVPLGIYSFTESRGSDMIVLINKKHSFFENLLFDPVYKNLAHFSKVPVLVLH